MPRHEVGAGGLAPGLTRFAWNAAQSALAIVGATVLACALTAALGCNPFLVLQQLIVGSLGDPHRFAEALARAIPLIMTGLAVSVAFRCQALNIGAEGQYLAGAMAASAMGVTLTDWPGGVLIVFLLFGSAMAGAFFALPAVLLENRRRVPLVLSTILLNFVAVHAVSFLTQGPLRGSDPSVAQSNPIARQAYLPVLVYGTDLHIGALIAAAIAVATWVFIRWGSEGFAMRAVGMNPVAAHWAGIDVRGVRRRVMCGSGALAGLAGGMQVAGVNHVLNIQASEQFGYVGIAVALLARLHPLGVVIAAVLIGMLDIGAQHLEQQPGLAVPADLAQVIKGALVLAVLVITGPGLKRVLSPAADLLPGPADGAKGRR